MPPGCSGERRDEGPTCIGNTCTHGMQCAWGLGWASALGHGDIFVLCPLYWSLVFLLGAQGRCCGVWEWLARKLLGVCPSCKSLPELSHPVRCGAVCPALLLLCHGCRPGLPACPGELRTRPVLEGQLYVCFWVWLRRPLKAKVQDI